MFVPADVKLTYILTLRVWSTGRSRLCCSGVLCSPVHDSWQNLLWPLEWFGKSLSKPHKGVTEACDTVSPPAVETCRLISGQNVSQCQECKVCRCRTSAGRFHVCHLQTDTFTSCDITSGQRAAQVSRQVTVSPEFTGRSLLSARELRGSGIVSEPLQYLMFLTYGF